MNKTVLIILAIYLLAINLIASLLAILDKRRAKRNNWRIPEATLLTLGIIGGALGEYITMKRIHHKTKHNKFMVGLPLEIFINIVIIVLIIYKLAF